MRKNIQYFDSPKFFDNTVNDYYQQYTVFVKKYLLDLPIN
jgi:hypothetical protein